MRDDAKKSEFKGLYVPKNAFERKSDMSISQARLADTEKPDAKRKSVAKKKTKIN